MKKIILCLLIACGDNIEPQPDAGADAPVDVIDAPEQFRNVCTEQCVGSLNSEMWCACYEQCAAMYDGGVP